MHYHANVEERAFYLTEEQMRKETGSECIVKTQSRAYQIDPPHRLLKVEEEDAMWDFSADSHISTMVGKTESPLHASPQ